MPDLQRIPFEKAIQQEFRPTRLGEWFGPSWSTHWFHVQLRIPNEFIGEEVHFIWNADNEAMIWSLEGMPLQGLTGGAGSDARHDYILTTNAEGGEIIQFYIEMACNGMFGAGAGLIGPPDPNRFFNLTEVVKANYQKRTRNSQSFCRTLQCQTSWLGSYCTIFKLFLVWQKI